MSYNYNLFQLFNDYKCAGHSDELVTSTTPIKGMYYQYFRSESVEFPLDRFKCAMMGIIKFVYEPDNIVIMAQQYHGDDGIARVQIQSEPKFGIDFILEPRDEEEEYCLDPYKAWWCVLESIFEEHDRKDGCQYMPNTSHQLLTLGSLIIQAFHLDVTMRLVWDPDEYDYTDYEIAGVDYVAPDEEEDGVNAKTWHGFELDESNDWSYDDNGDPCFIDFPENWSPDDEDIII